MQESAAASGVELTEAAHGGGWEQRGLLSRQELLLRTEHACLLWGCSGSALGRPWGSEAAAEARGMFGSTPDGRCGGLLPVRGMGIGSMAKPDLST